MGRREFDRVRRSARSGLLHDDGVLESGFLAQLFSDGLAEEVHIVFLEPLVKELGGDLNGQNRLLELHRFDRNEPRLESLGAYVVFNEGEAICPDTFVVEVHQL